MPKGVLRGDLLALAAPVGSALYFAGEHTNEMHWGCVHSAITSGLREAARLTQDPSLLPAYYPTLNRAAAEQRFAKLALTRLLSEYPQMADKFDINRDGSISAEELFDAARSAGDHLSLADCHFVIDALDRNRDGHLSLQELSDHVRASQSGP